MYTVAMGADFWVHCAPVTNLKGMVTRSSSSAIVAVLYAKGFRCLWLCTGGCLSSRSLVEAMNEVLSITRHRFCA